MEVYICNALKIWVSIFLSVVLLWQVSLKMGVVGYYYINKAYIAANVCENRDNPVLHCNGKCYLKQQLKKTESGDQDPRQLPNPYKNLNELQPFLDSELIKLPTPLAVKTTSGHFASNVLSSFSPAIFHPPAV